jgi:hypothetical protein
MTKTNANTNPWTKTRIEQIQVLKFKASNVLTFKTLIVSNAKDHGKLNPHTVIKGHTIKTHKIPVLVLYSVEVC